MKRTVDNLQILNPPQIIPIEMEKGRCAVAYTGNPFARQPPWFECYAILASWLPEDAPVGMFITFSNCSQAQNPFREVNNVYATYEFRGPQIQGRDSAPVEVGRWLFAEAYLTRHSPDRTDSGDHWAKKVGGELPERDQRGTSEAAEVTGADGLTRLNDLDWEINFWDVEEDA